MSDIGTKSIDSGTIVQRLRQPVMLYSNPEQINAERREAADIIELMRALPAWQPIETHPKDSDPCLIAEAGKWSGEAMFHQDVGEWWLAGNDPTDAHGAAVYPTHWQPLPSPPEADKP